MALEPRYHTLSVESVLARETCDIVSALKLLLANNAVAITLMPSHGHLREVLYHFWGCDRGGWRVLAGEGPCHVLGEATVDKVHRQHHPLFRIRSRPRTNRVDTYDNRTSSE